MSRKVSTSKGNQKAAVMGGAILIYFGLTGLISSVTQGWLHYTYRGITVTGWVAAFVILAFIAVGLWFVRDGLRKLRDLKDEA